MKLGFASKEHQRRRKQVLDAFGGTVCTRDQVGALLYPSSPPGKQRHAASMTLMRMWDEELCYRLDDGRWKILPATWASAIESSQ